MKFKLLLVLIFCIAFQFAFSQKYFDLFYTNIPKSEYNKYSSSFSSGMGWIQTGEYTTPAGCANCSDYSVDSKLRKTKLDSLVAEYAKSGLGKIYSKQYIPNNHHFVPGKQSSPLYIKNHESHRSENCNGQL